MMMEKIKEFQFDMTIFIVIYFLKNHFQND